MEKTITSQPIDLRHLSLFEEVSDDELVVVREAIAGSRDVAAGEVVCHEGEVADRWWIVDSGLADVTAGGLYTATVGAGETIGELALLDGEPRSATVTAVSEMVLWEVDGDAFLDCLHRSPHLAVALLRQLAARLRATNLRPQRPSQVLAPAPVAASRPSAPNKMFDPTVPGWHRDPAAHLAALREAGPLHWSDALSSWVVTRYEDVHRLSRSKATIASIATLEVPPGPNPDGTMPRPKPGHLMMINRDGADHARLRRLVAKVFTPRAVSAWRERASAIVDGLLAEAAGREEIEVVADYALRLPAQVITEMLGMPDRDTAQLRAWSHLLVLSLDPTHPASEDAAIDEAGRRFGDYLWAVIADKRAHPGEDILSDLLRAEDDGDVLDDKEVLAQVILLYIAGHETTLNLIGNGVAHLLANPGELELLRMTPDLDANAIEEVLRYESPAQLTRRVTVEPVSIGEETLPVGAHLTLLLASANRDPRKWGPTADVLDVARPGANEHVSFGGGPHYCLGAQLARMEAGVALPRFVRTFPALAAAYDEPDWVPRLGLRGLERLPVTLR